MHANIPDVWLLTQPKSVIPLKQAEYFQSSGLIIYKQTHELIL